MPGLCSDLIPHDLTKSSLPDKIAGQRLRQVEHLNSGDLLIDLSACGASAFGSKRVGRELTQNGRRHCYPLASDSNPVGSTPIAVGAIAISGQIRDRFFRAERRRTNRLAASRRLCGIGLSRGRAPRANVAAVNCFRRRCETHLHSCNPSAHCEVRR